MTTVIKVSDALRRVEAQIQQKQRRVGISKLSDALCFALRIPCESRELVLHLSPSPHCNSNLEAVGDWIEGQMLEPGLALSQSVLPIFVDLLSRKLRRIQEGAICD